MSDKEIRETLEKQLQLLSERSKWNGLNTSELVDLSNAMLKIADWLQNEAQ